MAVPAVNKSIFRIYRDTRFSLDPAPYKTNLGIYFWDGGRSRMESSGFYFQLEPPDLYLGGGMYMIPDSLLGRYRKAVVDPKAGPSSARSWPPSGPGPAFPSRASTISAFRRDSTPRHPNAELLKHKGLYASFETKVPEEFYSARLVDYCFERFEPIAPLHRWLMKLFG